MTDVLMPRLSDTMTEGVVAQWLKAEGDEVHRGDALAEIETDKATMELEAYASGVLTRIIAAPGTTVAIGEPVAVIGEPSAPAATQPEPEPVAPAPVGARPSRPGPAVVPPGADTRVKTSPLARALARKHGLDLATVTGTGPGGRVVRADVEAAVAGRAPVAAGPGPASPDRVPPVAPDDERLPLTRIRRVTAERLSQSAAAPHFHLTAVVDVGALLALRRDLNAALASAGTRVSVTDLLIRASALTLRAHPQVNSSWGGDHLLRRGRVNVGVAVARDDGLIVPVVRDADRKPIADIAVEAHALAERARAGTLTPDEFSGGTFTISNLGMFGIETFTAVINPPEAAILAVGAARDELELRDGALTTVARMRLTLTVDHRVLDGATGAAFLSELVAVLENPLRILV